MSVEMEQLKQIDPDYSAPRNDTRDETEASCFCYKENYDSEDGWRSGGRSPPSSKDELKYYMRCESLCCSTSAGEWCYERGINRCFCCFEGMDSLFSFFFWW